MARSSSKAASVEEIDEDHPRLQATCLEQNAPERQFIEAYNQGRLHHAWLLCGPKGTGKATFAYRAAKFLLAEEKTEIGGLFGSAVPPETLDRSSDDPGCRRVAAGSHADLTTLEPTKAGGQIIVEAADKLAAALRLTAGEGSWRVAIIDAADDLNISAANKLLKLIEEPPRNTILFLISHNPGRLLPTIRSRCTRVTFNTLSSDAIARILTLRRPETSGENISSVIELSSGSAGRALALLDSGGAEAINQLSQVLAGRHGAGVLAAEGLAASLNRNPFQYNVVTDSLISWLVLAAKPPLEAESEVGLPTDMVKLANAASVLGPKPWIELYEHATYRFERTKAVNLDPAQTLVDILARIQALLARSELRGS
ncbi:MAG: DNA polymerase III subunit delta' [Alphaproteobacteria bacterium]